MDVVSGNFAFDVKTGQVQGGASRQYLDPSISGEGTKVIMSDGQVVTYNPPPPQPVIPDHSKVKHLQKYYNRTDHNYFPMWLYHPSEPAVIAKSAQEAGEVYGVEWVETTEDERREYGLGSHRWKCSRGWQQKPFPKDIKFDPNNPVHGKNYIAAPAKPIDPTIAQNAMVEQLVTSLQSGNRDLLMQLAAIFAQAVGGSAPVLRDAAADLQTPVPAEALSSGHRAAMEAIKDDGERAQWESIAREANIKVDGRWSLKKLREYVTAELEKKAAPMTAESVVMEVAAETAPVADIPLVDFLGS